MNVYKKSFYSTTCLGLEDILEEVSQWIVSLNIGFTGYEIEALEPEVYDTTTRKEYKYSYLKNSTLGADLIISSYYRKTYEDNTYSTLTGIAYSSSYSYPAFGLHRVKSGESYKNVGQRIYISPNCSDTTTSGTYGYKVNMSVYVKDKFNILIGYEDGTRPTGDLLGCEAGVIICSAGTEEFFSCGLSLLSNSLSANMLSNTITEHYCFPNFAKGAVSMQCNNGAYIAKIKVSDSSNSTYSNGRTLDYIYETNAANLVNGETYAIDGKSYLCINSSKGIFFQY